MNNMNNKVVQYCASLGKKCGLATYTEMLCEAQGLKKIACLKDLGDDIPSHIHLQHEFSVVPLDELDAIINFCKTKNVKLYITMHNVIPFANTIFFWAICLGQNICKRIIKKLIFNRTHIDHYKGRHLLGERSQYKMIKHAHKLIVHTQEAKAALIKMGARFKQVQVVAHGIALHPTSDKIHSQSDGKLHVGCFGFLKSYKGLEYVIDACKQVENVALHIYASEEHFQEEDWAKGELIKKIKECEWIQLDTRHLHLSQIVFNLSQCDVNIYYPLFMSNFGTSGAVRQYLAAKRPIIASDTYMVSDIKHIIQVVKPEDPDALARAIKNYNPETKKIEAYIQNYTWDKVKTVYE